MWSTGENGNMAMTLHQVSEIAAQLKRAQNEIERLQTRMEMPGRLDTRMRDLEIGLVTNRRAFAYSRQSTSCILGSLALCFCG